MDHLQVNSCVTDIFQLLWEFPRSWSPVGDVVYAVDVEDDVESDVRLDRFEDVGDVEDAVI